MSHWFKSGNNATELQTATNTANATSNPLLSGMLTANSVQVGSTVGSITNTIGELSNISDAVHSVYMYDIDELMEQYGSFLTKLDEVRTQQIKALAVMLALDADSDDTHEDAMQRARHIVQNYESSMHRFSVTNYEEYKNVREGIRKKSLEASNTWMDYMGTVRQQTADLFSYIDGHLNGSVK